MIEIPIQVAVRIATTTTTTTIGALDAAADANSSEIDANGNECQDNNCLQCITLPTHSALQRQTDNCNGIGGGSMAAGLVQVGVGHSFPVTHALSQHCNQAQLFQQTVLPLITLFLEGYDASVVAYGQSGSGKSYTLFGQNFSSIYMDDAAQGVVQRCVREIYAHMAQHTERTYVLNLGWVQICDDVIVDLLGVGNVHCHNIEEVFRWLQLGLNKQQQSEAVEAHTLCTLTLEQQWINQQGLLQHRLSTASFSDLCGTERLYLLNEMDQPISLLKNPGLQALEQVVNTLTEPAIMYGVNGNIPYNQTTLTTLLKDSFGGRAQTLLILCVSPLAVHMNETLCNLQFAFKVQCVRNYVVMNRFSDDNTLVAAHNELNTAAGADNFGLQFAASQWFKLVSNAEGLFAKLMSSNAINDMHKEQIEEWLFLKQECEECLSSSEVVRSQKQLVPIQEEEPEETLSEPETSCQQNSDNESDSESQRPDLAEKLETLMEELRSKNDALVKQKYQEFIHSQPKAVMKSQESNVAEKQDQQEQQQLVKEEVHVQPTEKLDERRSSLAGRRRSIQPGASLSSAEIAMLNRVASREQQVVNDDFLENAVELQQVRHAHNSPLENIQKKLRKLNTDIEAKQRQIAEVEQTMQLKQNIVTELVKNSETRSNAKQRFHKKKSKLEAEYEKIKKQLTKATVQGREKSELERLREIMSHLKQRLQDLSSMKQIAGESGQKIKKLQQSIAEYKKVIEELQKKLKKEKKLQQQLELELKTLQEKENKDNKALVKLHDLNNMGEEERGRNLKEVQARISHLDHVLREKSENLEQYGNAEGGVEQQEGLRHEIRNLRRTRDHLLEQRCSLDRKLKRNKVLSQREERKLLECDEAIEAIDAAIEFKNELICGHKSIDTSERLQREKGEQMLMARLNKLSAEEMRTLLYKYFTKVIDLRDSSRKLEVQLMSLERERDAWEWKERVLCNAVRQARLEGERNAVLLQRQHEMKLTLMLRHMAEDTSASCNSFGSEQQQQVRHLRAAANLALTSPYHQLHGSLSPSLTRTNSSQYSDTEFDMDFYKNAALPLKPPKHGEMEICPLPDALSKYKPLDKLKEKERETKRKLFAKFTRYAAGQHTTTAMSEQQQMTTAAVASTTHAISSGGNSKNKKDKQDAAGAAIPQENLKRLMAAPSATKVTRQKNKIIIQDASRKN